MTSLTYRLPAELEQRLNRRLADVQAPADLVMHDGKLNMGPTILLAATLSAGCWAIMISLGLSIFH
jgi:hypothetical protein